MKEIAGFLGAVLIAVPWLKDFGRRIGLGKKKQVKAVGSLKTALQEVIARDEHWLGRAKIADLIFTLSGLSLIAASFLIGLCLANSVSG
ncbi:MAG: hypothetical protein ACXWUO_02075 [Allosphingosinicella sp.]